MPRDTRLSQRAHWAVGQPISYLMQEALARPELISLAAGFVDQQSLPTEATLEAIEYVLADPDRGRAALQYTSTMGDEVLREQLIERLASADQSCPISHRLSVDQVILTAGSNAFLYLLGEILLDPEDIVLCAAPTYFVYLGGLANLSARSVGVAVDNEGIIPEAVEETLRDLAQTGDLPRVKAIYVCSYYDNPSSLTLSAARRSELVDIAKRYSQNGTIYIIEDTAYRELRYYGDDIPSLSAADEEGETVIHTGSFSKSFSPGLRVGWGILPTPLVEPFCSQKGNIDFGSPHFSQRVMSAVLELGKFDQHVEKLRQSYRAKLQAMLDAADEFLRPLGNVSWFEAQGGLYVWLKVEGVDTGSTGLLFAEAMKQGVLYVPGVHCYPDEGEPARTDMIRLSFGVQPLDRIRDGIACLARAIEHVSAGTVH